MQIGVIKEIKDNERRVGLTPAGAKLLIDAGHTVVISHGAGLGSGFDDAQYLGAGARMVDTHVAWASDLVVKVKEPLESEYRYLERQILFTYLHLAGVPRSLTEALLSAGTTAIAYEGVQDAAGRLPLLAPMSAVAGSMAPLVGAHYLAKPQGGRGVLPCRLFSEPQGRIAVVGDGVVGRHAARVAASLGARVVLFGRHPEPRAGLRDWIGADFEYAESSTAAIERYLPETDLLVGAVRVELGRAPHIISRDMVALMPSGSVIVDVSIDQGGCVETSRPTTHSEPVFSVQDVIHYCVANMPGAYPRTSTMALAGASLPYVQRLAEEGLQALTADPAFARGLYTYRGFLTCREIAATFGLEDAYREFTSL